MIVGSLRVRLLVREARSLKDKRQVVQSVKDDVREVREGFECGMKVAGYDDIKPDDVIEAYRIEQVQRTLS